MRDYFEDFALRSDSGLDHLRQRRLWLMPALVLGSLATAFVWIGVLSFPYIAADLLWTGVGSKSVAGKIAVLAVPFTPPFITAFALSNLLFPSSSEPKIASGLMSTFEYRQRSGRRWLIILVSVMFGACNFFLVAIALSAVTGN